jgi:hypothetical protein
VSSGVPGLIGKEHAVEERREVSFFLEGQDEVETIPRGADLCGSKFIQPVVVVWEEGQVAQRNRRTLE